MWYFSWILGTGLACAFAILNALWLEFRVDNDPALNEDISSS
ncbi:MAG: cytochrome bd-I oxidase subunit CydX [Legionella sp.]|jgi:cyd operon protein YbgT|nr:cytochrome bd-I oxidase subunit CydX [Legionella sp.]